MMKNSSGPGFGARRIFLQHSHTHPFYDQIEHASFSPIKSNHHSDLDQIDYREVVSVARKLFCAFRLCPRSGRPIETLPLFSRVFLQLYFACKALMVLDEEMLIVSPHFIMIFIVMLPFSSLSLGRSVPWASGLSNA
jgi:hypothetical protein